MWMPHHSGYNIRATEEEAISPYLAGSGALYVSGQAWIFILSLVAE